MILKISYMSGAGNLFTVIDNSKYQLSIGQAGKLAPVLCGINEHNSFRTEGLILIDEPKTDGTDFSAQFFNPDGSNDAMCGNGGRCAVAFANCIPSIQDFKYNSFSMAGDKYNFEIENDQISLFFHQPKSYIPNKSVQVGSRLLTGTFVDVGTKHFVIDFAQFTELSGIDFREFDIMQIAPEIRYAEAFAPHGVNVNIYKIIDGVILLRTYERGVEFETGACGTGAISTAFTASLNHALQFPIRVIPPSDIALTIDCDQKNNLIILKGPAIILKTIEIDID